MRCIIAGSRTCTRDQVFAAMQGLDPLVLCFLNEVVSGCARGADTYGEEWAASVGIPVHQMPADWDRFGRSAGYRRNEDMANYAGKDGVLVAIWDGESRGTKHMIDIATRVGMRVIVVRM